MNVLNCRSKYKFKRGQSRRNGVSNIFSQVIWKNDLWDVDNNCQTKFDFSYQGFLTKKRTAFHNLKLKTNDEQTFGCFVVSKTVHVNLRKVKTQTTGALRISNLY